MEWDSVDVCVCYLDTADETSSARTAIVRIHEFGCERSIDVVMKMFYNKAIRHTPSMLIMPWTLGIVTVPLRNNSVSLPSNARMSSMDTHGVFQPLAVMCMCTAPQKMRSYCDTIASAEYSNVG